MAKKNELTLNSNDPDDIRRNLIASINKQFGIGTLIDPGATEYIPIDVIPTGSIAIDLALQVGGIPRGRITEIYGRESSGKSTLVNHIIASAERIDPTGYSCLFDLENSFDKAYGEQCGIIMDKERFSVSYPRSGEQMFDVMEALVKNKGVTLIVVDSIDGIVPLKEIEGNNGDNFPGLRARLIAQALRKIHGPASENNVAIVFTNQLREKIGVMYGSPDVTPGGRAMKFYTSVRIQTTKIADIKNGDKIVGVRSRAKVVKSKVAAPFGIAEFDIHFKEGISRESGIVDAGAEMGIIDKAGAWYSYNGEKLGNGREAARIALKNDPILTDTIYNKIMETAALNAVPAVLNTEDAEDEEPEEYIEE